MISPVSVRTGEPSLSLAPHSVAPFKYHLNIAAAALEFQDLQIRVWLLHAEAANMTVVA